MKKNVFTYVLIVIVAAVWGVVFYRIFDSSGNKRATEQSVKVEHIGQEKQRKKLSMNYRDPFETQMPELPMEQITASIEEQPPTFIYKGLIKGMKNRIIIVEYNGVSEVIRMTDSIMGFKIMSIDKDSLIVRKNGPVYRLGKE